MLKYLFVLSIFLLFVTIANAQTDTTVNHQPADTTIKQVDTTIKHKADTPAKHKSISKHVSYTVTIKPPPAPVDTTLRHSTVKTINDIRYNAYVKGEDWDDMALAGDLNHFPSPDKVLKYKKQLDLSPIQVGQLTKLADALHHKKLEMGTNIIRNEKMLDSLFRTHIIDEGSLIFYTNRSGLYYGELKGAILMACFNAEKLLTPAQIKKLEALEKTSGAVK